jgi:hypothetical protein
LRVRLGSLFLPLARNGCGKDKPTHLSLCVHLYGERLTAEETRPHESPDRFRTNRVLVATKMSTENQRDHSRTHTIGPLLNAILIFGLLLSGIAVVFIGRVTEQTSARFLFLGIGLGVELAAVLLIALYSRFRLLRAAPRQAS